MYLPNNTDPQHAADLLQVLHSMLGRMLIQVQNGVSVLAAALVGQRVDVDVLLCHGGGELFFGGGFADDKGGDVHVFHQLQGNLALVDMLGLVVHAGLATPADDENHRNSVDFVAEERGHGIDDVALAANGDYPMRGINEIMRLHLTRFTQKMDNPSVPIDSIDEDGRIITEDVQKIYHVNIVFQLEHDKEREYHHFRITMTRKGVLDIEELV